MKKLSVNDVAKLMGCSREFIRAGMESGILPIGCVISRKKRNTYYISPKLLFEYTGIKVEGYDSFDNGVCESQVD